jgi:hypothetical protein
LILSGNYHLLATLDLSAKIKSKGGIMKKFAWLWLASFYTLGALAQELTCLDKLLPFSRFSGLHHLSREEWNDGKDYLDAENSRLALNSLLGGKLLCRSGEVQIKIAPVCQVLLADIPHSNVCYVHTNLGYFVISRDNGRNVNFIFSKDRRFADPRN